MRKGIVKKEKSGTSKLAERGISSMFSVECR